MENQLRKLFEPIKIGPMEIKNRIVMPAMGLNLGADGQVTDSFKAFYEERARGGVGLIVIGLAPLLDLGPILSSMVGVYSDELIPGLRQFADLMHKCGTKVAVQISALGVLPKDDGSLELVGPSQVSVDRRPFVPKPRSLNVEEIERFVQAYGEGARRVRDAGFDAVEINAIAGTSLICHFLSAHTNKRTDAYGGDIKNRAKFLLECIEIVKQRVGKDYALLCRVSGADFMEGGNTLEDTKIVAGMIERAGIHAINVSTGWHESPVPFIQMSVPRANWIYLAEGVKKVVHTPVIGGTRIPDPRLAERILQEGRVDMVYVARPLIADPEWPNKAKEGRFDEIRPCIACCSCFDGLPDGQSVHCSVNYRAGREVEYSIKPVKQAKKVFIIGGGPAGMEAARVAALRGHQVTLTDNKEQLGGQLLVAVQPPYKEELQNFIAYLARQMEKLGIKVHLREEVTSKIIEESKPDVVIVATGAQPIIPEIFGVSGNNVVTAIEVLSGRRQVGKKVAIVGGGLVGCETAEFLTQNGHQVTILEMLERIGVDIGRTTRWVTLGRLRELGVNMESNAKVEEITDKGVKVGRQGGNEFFEADSVVLAVGMKSNRRLAQELEGKLKRLYVIGDGAKPGKIAEAMESAMQVALEV